MRALQQVRVFLASPGDVSEERRLAREVVQEVNQTVGESRGLTIRLVGWDTDAAPDWGGDPQSRVNEQIADMSDYDLFVGILWNRFGAATPRAGSGTEEEFNLAVDEFEANGK